MAGYKGVFSVGVILYDGCRKGTRVAHISTYAEEVAVHKPRLFLLKNRVEQFKHLSSNDLIISIDNHENLEGLTRLLSCLSQIRHRPHLLLIYYNLVPFQWHFILTLQKFLNLLAGSIVRCIINENYMEICVILHDD